MKSILNGCHIKTHSNQVCASGAINLKTFQYATIQKYGALIVKLWFMKCIENAVLTQVDESVCFVCTCRENNLCTNALPKLLVWLNEKKYVLAT